MTQNYILFFILDFMILFTILFLSSFDIQEDQKVSFSENIEYCQNVYITWENPLNEKCDFEEVEKSLFINF